MGDTTHAGKLIDRWTLLTWLGVGVFMVWAAGHYTVYDDEARSCRLYAMPMGDMVRSLWDGIDPDPPLYYLPLNLWVSVFGVGPLGMRSYSIVAFLAGLVVMRGAARAWFDRRTGLVTMLLCALHPAHLFFGFAGRWYSVMFLMVAILLWCTARLRDRGSGRRMIAWTLAAAGVCYANYFGTAVVALVWFVGIWRDRRDRRDLRRWVVGAIGVALLYAVWFIPFWDQVTGFDKPSGSWLTYPSGAARTLMALLTGNLASIGAWWVWAPMFVFGVAFLFLLVNRWREVWPIAVVVLGCFAAGVATRTMIDKYVMTFSGPVCLLVAAVWTSARTRATDKAPATNGRALRPYAPRLLIYALTVAWIGCGVNLVTQRQWSSLRWLDPFEEVTESLHEQNWHRTYPDAVTSHPSARYYFARLQANDSLQNPLQKKIAPFNISSLRTDPTEWLAALEAQDRTDQAAPYYAVTPAVMTSLLKNQAADAAAEGFPVVIVLETPGFVVSPDWDALNAVLSERYEQAGEPVPYLEDPDAAWKDRLDPRVRHPQWRIVLHYWLLPSDEEESNNSDAPSSVSAESNSARSTR